MQKSDQRTMSPVLDQRDLHLRRPLKDQQLEDVNDRIVQRPRRRSAEHRVEPLYEAPEELCVGVGRGEHAELVAREELEDLVRFLPVVRQPGGYRGQGRSQRRLRERRAKRTREG